jgi:hypothetical protein
MKNSLILQAVMVAAAGLVSVASAAEAPTSDAAKVDAILAKYVEALGGRAAIERITNSVAKAVSSVNGSEIQLEIIRAAPALQASRVEIPGMGTMREAYDGRKAWAANPFQGVSERTGEELAKVARDAAFHQPLQMKQLFALLTYTGRETVGGKTLEVLTARLPGGAVEKFRFSADTGLLVERESEHDVSTGRMKSAIKFEDYRPVDGLQQPHRVQLTLEPPDQAMLELEMKITEIRQNVKLPDNAFAKPE